MREIKRAERTIASIVTSFSAPVVEATLQAGPRESAYVRTRAGSLFIEGNFLLLSTIG